MPQQEGFKRVWVECRRISAAGMCKGYHTGMVDLNGMFGVNGM